MTRFDDQRVVSTKISGHLVQYSESINDFNELTIHGLLADKKQ